MIEAAEELARADRSLTRIEELFGLFGEIPPTNEPVSSSSVPEPQRSLLDHERHMTVTLERHYAGPVQLEVLEQLSTEPFYARRILLRGPDGRVVQYGIMRIDLRRVQEPVRDRILSGDAPLGRILVDNEVLRRISTHGLLALRPDENVRSTLSSGPVPVAVPEILYGRLATILCNESPAVDLLEVVTGA